MALPVGSSAVLADLMTLRDDIPPVLEPLTLREREVLRLLAKGLSNRSIAGDLFISPRTAESHVQHIYAKIDVSSRAAATESAGWMVMGGSGPQT